MDDESPVAAVTGAADGIGLAAARLFARRGYRVALIDIEVRKAADRAADLGGAHVGIACDVSKEADVRKACQEIADRLGRLDVLVNNAGVGSPHVPTTEQSVENLNKFSAFTSRERFFFRGRPMPSWRRADREPSSTSVRSQGYVVFLGAMPMAPPRPASLR